jgi:hypothetical protein
MKDAELDALRQDVTPKPRALNLASEAKSRSA